MSLTKLLLACAALWWASAFLAADYPIQPVPFTAVRVQDSFWSPRLETNRTITVRGNFKRCEERRLRRA